eukprot:CAMPEP_0169152536 /NCGR_PEP_ID=MMETSP1015-20121227/51562_1 /TAXON_ID=342587 /ORGANISM="Karlodinium micrum, Strain CCMP2283" /LENGTH=130 /DNA_ID=CAMNT_0009222329 /DNA_START=950 /DNA_END=1339 /DNA_ORIENTATION=-
MCFLGGARLVTSGGGRGKDDGGISPSGTGSKPCLLRCPLCLRNFAAAVIWTTSGPFEADIVDDFASASCTDDALDESWNDRRASRSGKRTGARGTCQSTCEEPSCKDNDRWPDVELSLKPSLACSQECTS